jgi:chromosome segregation ATPase
MSQPVADGATAEGWYNPTMTDITDATASETPETPAGEQPAAATATPDELATLKNRNSGLNAKVTDLQKQLAAEQAARTAAEQAAAGKAGTDDVLNKRIAELTAELEAGKKAAALATKGAQYPEAFRELGEDIAGMSTEKLAALEARLTAAKDEGEEETTERPRPVGNNPPRTTTSKRIEDMTKEELNAEWAKVTPADMGLSPS